MGLGTLCQLCCYVTFHFNGKIASGLSYHLKNKVFSLNISLAECFYFQFTLPYVPPKSECFCSFVLVFILIIQSSLLVCKNILRHSMKSSYRRENQWEKENMRKTRENQGKTGKIRELFPWSGEICVFQIDSGSFLVSWNFLILQLFVIAGNFKDCT